MPVKVEYEVYRQIFDDHIDTLDRQIEAAEKVISEAKACINQYEMLKEKAVKRRNAIPW